MCSFCASGDFFPTRQWDSLILAIYTIVAFSHNIAHSSHNIDHSSITLPTFTITLNILIFPDSLYFCHWINPLHHIHMLQSLMALFSCPITTICEPAGQHICSYKSRPTEYLHRNGKKFPIRIFPQFPKGEGILNFYPRGGRKKAASSCADS